MSILVCYDEHSAIVAITVCDECKKELGRRPAEKHDHPGTTLLVANRCKDCAPKHCFSLYHPVTEVVGMGIGNLNAVAKVTLQ